MKMIGYRSGRVKTQKDAAAFLMVDFFSRLLRHLRNEYKRSILRLRQLHKLGFKFKIMFFVIAVTRLFFFQMQQPPIEK